MKLDEYVYFAGHGEYLPPGAQAVYCDDGEPVPEWLEDKPEIYALGWNDDRPDGCFVLMRCSRAELVLRAERLFDELSEGPLGGDDDAYNYWPSGVRLLKQMMEDIGNPEREEEMFRRILEIASRRELPL